MNHSKSIRTCQLLAVKRKYNDSCNCDPEGIDKIQRYIETLKGQKWNIQHCILVQHFAKHFGFLAISSVLCGPSCVVEGFL